MEWVLIMMLLDKSGTIVMQEFKDGKSCNYAKQAIEAKYKEIRHHNTLGVVCTPKAKD